MRILLPESADERLARRAHHTCVSVRTIRKASCDVTVCMDIDIPEVRALIRSVKYRGHPEAAEKIAEFITPYLRALCEQEHIDSIVPIPLSGSRRRSRGYNQVAYVLSRCIELEPSLKGTVRPEILTRVTHTKPQTSLTRSMRLHNMKDAFQATRPLTHQKVLIVDDVVTTGATLLEAKRAITAHGGVAFLFAFAGR